MYFCLEIRCLECVRVKDRWTFDLSRKLDCELIRNHSALVRIEWMLCHSYFLLRTSGNLFPSDFLLLTSVDSHVNENQPSAFSFLIQASITRFALPLLVGRLSYVTSLTSSCLSFSRERKRGRRKIRLSFKKGLTYMSIVGINGIITLSCFL